MRQTKVFFLISSNGCKLHMNKTFSAHEETVKFLIRNRANGNVVNKNGDTALIRAAGSGKF